MTTLDLERHRDVGDLLSTTFGIFGSRLAVFLSVTLVIVAPAVILIDGIWGRALAEGRDADPSTAATVSSLLVGIFVIPALVTALHVVIVQRLARGEEPAVGDALRSAVGRFLPAVGAVVLYSLGVAVGLVLLIVPGIWIGVRWYFAAQAAVVDGLSPGQAVQRSAELVKGRWWPTFGRLVLAGLIFGLIGAVPIGLLELVEDGVVYVVGQILVQTVTLSLTALFGTLLFFDLRARKELPWQGSAVVDPSAPERPSLP